MQCIDPHAAADLVRRGAVIVDIREPDEYARERIPGACHRPLAQLQTLPDEAGGAHAVVFHCRSGMRTASHAERLARIVGARCDAYLLEGGLDAWKRAGLPVQRDPGQPLELNRQVQIAAGTLVLLGAILGATVAPAWHAVSAAVGAGLVLAGVSGVCGLARLLRRMPWNRALRG